MAAAFARAAGPALTRPPDQSMRALAGPGRPARAGAPARARPAPADVRVIPAAAGGPEGAGAEPAGPLPVRPLAARQRRRPCTCSGASIGAWRMACACLPDADAALAELAEDYITQHYAHAPGKHADAAQRERGLRRQAAAAAGAARGRGAGPPAAPAARLHQPRPPPAAPRQGGCAHAAGLPGRVRWPTPRAAARWAAGWSAWSSATRATRCRSRCTTTARTACRADAAEPGPAMLASCSIPFWLDAGAGHARRAAGAYWDGGITDYHLHLDYAAMADGLVLYPHFQQPRRARLAGQGLEAPPPRHARSWTTWWCWRRGPSGCARCRGGKLPDRSDFKPYGDDEAGRQRDWRRALAESQRLADEFAELVASCAADRGAAAGLTCAWARIGASHHPARARKASWL